MSHEVNKPKRWNRRSSTSDRRHARKDGDDRRNEKVKKTMVMKKKKKKKRCSVWPSYRDRARAIHLLASANGIRTATAAVRNPRVRARRIAPRHSAHVRKESARTCGGEKSGIRQPGIERVRSSMSIIDAKSTANCVPTATRESGDVGTGNAACAMLRSPCSRCACRRSTRARRGVRLLRAHRRAARRRGAARCAAAAVGLTIVDATELTANAPSTTAGIALLVATAIAVSVTARAAPDVRSAGGHRHATVDALWPSSTPRYTSTKCANSRV